MTDFNEKELFMALILNFQMSAMIGMGKMANPLSNKIERNLDEAKRSIDMANMLANKTKGNLEDDEDRLMQNVLTELRLNFVQESAKPDPEPEAQEETKEETSEPAQEGEEAEEEKKE